MEIKYEVVFGPQELFDGMMGDCEFASEEYGYIFANGVLYYCERYNEKAGWSLSRKNHLTFKPSAMRRIIRTPIWTVEDQQAGRLPEVGCLVTTYDHKQYVFVGESCHNAQWSLRDVESGKVYHTPISLVLPIESPEEKAARLEDEWVDAAYGNTRVFSCATKDENDRLKEHLRAIYRAQLSGDLPVPVKGE